MPKKKIVEEDQEEEEKYEWNKPRIAIFFFVLAILVVGGLLAKHFFLDAQNTSQQSVQGASTSADQSLPSVQSVQHGVQQELSNLQQQAADINVKDIASSSPQVQEVIKQLQQLPQVPGDVAKQTCEQLCGKL